MSRTTPLDDEGSGDRRRVPLWSIVAFAVVAGLGIGRFVTIGADDDIDVAIDTMKSHAVRRLPVIDGDKVVGMVSQADIARVANDKQVGRLVETISAAPDNSGRG